MRSVVFSKVCVVLVWLGWRGSLARYRWGVVGNRWPTVYAGPLKLITGPGRVKETAP